MKPLSDFTTPRRLICPISRHFFPVEHPDPAACCTTGLKNGSRFPVMAHFFSSGFGLAATSLLPSAALLLTPVLGVKGSAPLAWTGSLASITGCAFAGFLATLAVWGFFWAVAGVGLLAAAGLIAAGPFAPEPGPGLLVCGAAACGAAAVGFAGAGAGVPAASSAAPVSLACFCCSDFAMLRALSMASGFCPQAAPVVIVSATASMLVVSFIAIPICSRLPEQSRAWPRVRPLPAR